MRILTLALGIPFPPIGGGLTRTYHLLKALAAVHDVTLAAFTYGEAHEAPPYPVRLETVPWEWSQAYREMTGDDVEAARRAYERLTYEDPNPWFASVMDPAAMEETLERLIAVPPDLVLLEGTPLARFIPSLPADVPCVLDLFDVHSVMAGRTLDGASSADRPAASREAERTLTFERRAVRRMRRLPGGVRGGRRGSPCSYSALRRCTSSPMASTRPISRHRLVLRNGARCCSPDE